jgi:uncharacterized protein YcfJ
MDTTLGSSIVAAIAGQVQSAVIGKIVAMDATTASSAQGGGAAVNLVDAAQQNIDSLVNLSAGIGTNVDMTV